MCLRPGGGLEWQGCEHSTDRWRCTRTRAGGLTTRMSRTLLKRGSSEAPTPPPRAKFTCRLPHHTSSSNTQQHVGDLCMKRQRRAHDQPGTSPCAYQVSQSEMGPPGLLVGGGRLRHAQQSWGAAAAGRHGRRRQRAHHSCGRVHPDEWRGTIRRPARSLWRRQAWCRALGTCRLRPRLGRRPVLAVARAPGGLAVRGLPLRPCGGLTRCRRARALGWMARGNWWCGALLVAYRPHHSVLLVVVFCSPLNSVRSCRC